MYTGIDEMLLHKIRKFTWGNQRDEIMYIAKLEVKG